MAIKNINALFASLRVLQKKVKLLEKQFVDVTEDSHVEEKEAKDEVGHNDLVVIMNPPADSKVEENGYNDLAVIANPLRNKRKLSAVHADVGTPSKDADLGSASTLKVLYGSIGTCDDELHVPQSSVMIEDNDLANCDDPFDRMSQDDLQKALEGLKYGMEAFLLWQKQEPIQPNLMPD